jgi:hypothetical protein
LLSKTAILLARLATEHDMVVITVNIVTRRHQGMPPSLSGWSSSLCVGRNDKMMLIPAMGKYWRSIPAVRILMTSVRTDTEITNVKQLEIIKSEYYKTGLTALIKITNQGVI